MADISSLLNTYISQPRGFQGITPGFQGLGQILGQQYLARKQAQEEMAREIALMQIKSRMRSPLEELIESGKAVDAAVSMGNMDLANKIRGRFGSMPKAEVMSSSPLLNRSISGNIALQTPESETKFVPKELDVFGNPTGYKPIETSWEERKFGINKQNAAQQVKESAQKTIDTIAEVKKGLRYFGAAGDMPPWPAEYSKKNWVANYDTLINKLVVDLMLQLKAASPTGSTGFGQLSEKEGMRLEMAATALRKGLSEEDALRHLNVIEEGARKILLGGTTKQTSQETTSEQNEDFSYMW